MNHSYGGIMVTQQYKAWSVMHSRFGLHVVEVLEREPGVVQAFEVVSGAVIMSLRQQAYITALRQFLRLLAGLAVVEGVKFDAADTPLSQ